MNRTIPLESAIAVLLITAGVMVVTAQNGRPVAPGPLQGPAGRAAQIPVSPAIVLGVGSPVINGERSGTSIAVVAAGTVYVFDAGPGVERRMMEARLRLASLGVREFGPIFLTHLHIDHTLGLAALYRYHQFASTGVLTFGLKPLTVFGPTGTRDLMNHVAAAFAPWNPIEVYTHELQPPGGDVYRDAQVTVKAFAVVHKEPGPWFGYRVEAAGRVIVISGDTRPVDAVVEACKGCDILFHEVHGLAFGPDGPTGTAQGHTSAAELGEIAKRANPKLLVLYHNGGGIGAEALIREVGRSFRGPIVYARDLDVF